MSQPSTIFETRTMESDEGEIYDLDCTSPELELDEDSVDDEEYTYTTDKSEAVESAVDESQNPTSVLLSLNPCHWSPPSTALPVSKLARKTSSQLLDHDISSNQMMYLPTLYLTSSLPDSILSCFENGFPETWKSELSTRCSTLSLSFNASLSPLLPSTPQSVKRHRPCSLTRQGIFNYDDEDFKEANWISTMRKSGKRSDLAKGFAERMESLERSQQDPSALINTPESRRRDTEAGDLVATLLDEIDDTPPGEGKQRMLIERELNWESSPLLSPPKAKKYMNNLKNNCRKRSSCYLGKTVVLFASPKGS
ncbi:hypothetical protein GEMRC1_001052 [Eukaryota sp. GEM-RC1]